MTDLQNKWWYRLVKVVYIIAFLLFFWVPPYISILSYKPYVNDNESRYFYRCDDGTEWGKTADIDGYELNYAKDDFSYNNPIRNGAEMRCANSELARDELVTKIKAGEIDAKGIKNYTVTPLKVVYYGSWLSAIFVSALSLFGILVFFGLVRAIFLYVVANKPFWKTLIFKKTAV